MVPIFPPIINELNRLFCIANEDFLFVSPWIKNSVLEHLLGLRDCQKLHFRVLTVAENFLSGSSDIKAIETLLNLGPNRAEIRLIKNLHAKIYIADKRVAIISSANLTESGLLRNIEIGTYLTDSQISPIIEKTDEWFALGKAVDRDWMNLMNEKISQIQTDMKELKSWEGEILCRIGENLGGNNIVVPEPELPFGKRTVPRKGNVSDSSHIGQHNVATDRKAKPFGSSDYELHYNVSRRIYDQLSPTLKALVKKPEFKEKPVIDQELRNFRQHV